MKKNLKKWLFWGVLCTVASLQLSAQNTEKNKKTQEQISRIAAAKKTNKHLRGGGLEQVGVNANESLVTKSKNWITKEGAVQIIAHCSDDVNGLIQELTLLGTSNIKTYGKTVTGFIPMDNVPKLESCKHLRSVVPSYKPYRKSGGVNSEGDRAMFTENVRKRYNVDGTGLKIGVISDSYNTQGLADREVIAGELPGLGNPFGYTKPVQVVSEIIDPSNALDEGRAMAQIIHDVAPGAELFFYAGFNGYFDFADGIKALAAKGCNIIVDDLGYFEDPFFQDGLLSQAVEEVSKKGVMYFTSCGNFTNRGFEAAYKEFSVTDGQQITNNYFDFGNQDQTQTITVPSFTQITFVLQWDAPSSRAGSANPIPEIDLDVFLVDALTGEVVDSFITDNVQDLSNFETVSYFNLSDNDQDLEIVIRNSLGKKPTRIKYIEFTDNIIFKEQIAGINAPTIYGLSNTKSAMSIGANSAGNTPAFARGLELQSFSSVGGGFGIILDKDGNAIPEQFRNKPDLVGPDDVSTTVPGFGLFKGTSAAAPHVAAVAALIKQSNKSLTREQIFDLLVKTAEDMDNPYTEGFDKGFDFATGNGFVVADKAVAVSKNRPTIYRYELINAATQQKYVPLNKPGGVLNNGDSIDLSDVEDGALLNIRALVVNGLNNNITTFLRYTSSNGQAGGSVDGIEPYSVFGDRRGVYNKWVARIGEYQLRGAVVLGTRGAVSGDGIYNLSFKVVNSAIPVALLITNNNTERGLTRPITEGSIVDLSTIDIALRNSLNLRAILSNLPSGNSFPPIKQTGEVKFKLSGAQNYVGNDILRARTRSNFDVFSDVLGNPIPWNPQPVVGKYKLETQHFARRGDVTTAGKNTIINFEIIDSSVPPPATNNASSNIVQNSLSIYPNPSVDGSIAIKTEKNESLTFMQIFDANGILVFSKVGKLDNTRINVSNLKDGIYSVKANDGKGNTYNGKLIIKQ
jgi:subtilisin family serine protease